MLSLRGHLVISGNIFGCYNLGDGATGILWAEARDAAKLPAMHRSASHDRVVLSERVSTKVDKCYPGSTRGRCT